eukprot:scaffold18707_cov80-Skeletonema_dohrnii-CCMP3373.AAC.5
MSTDNSNHYLSEFLSFETKQHQSSSSDDTTIGRHALDQLLESKLGNEITWCAQQLAVNNNHNDKSGNISSSILEEEVTKLMGTPAFQQINAQIRECPLSLILPSNQTTSVNNRSEDDITMIGSNKKSREGSAAASNNKPATATTSFSLFDLMDSQKGSFMLPPRIMAQQVIDADQRHDNNIMTTNNSNDDTVQNNPSSSDNTADSTQQAAANNNNNSKSALELLEQAEDMEDLSPNIDSWEQIRSILYRGLTNKTNVVERRRYFKVHMLMLDKCQKTNGGGGGMFRSQTWGLTFNIVGLILSLSNEFDKTEDEQIITTDLDLYWESCHHLVLSLSHLAMEYVTSSVGHEKEMERMILGLCSILCTDVSSCVLAMMEEPMSGWFEVWARFVGPSTLMSILRVTGLGEVVLRRCGSRGRNEASKRLHEMIRQRDGSSVTLKLEDLEESNFLQSLSILRVITSRCDATLESMGSIFCCNATSSSFLSADGIVSSDEVQAMLETKDHCLSIEEQEEIKSRVLKPFRDVLLLRKSTPGLVDADLEELCTQTVSLIEQLC